MLTEMLNLIFLLTKRWEFYLVICDWSESVFVFCFEGYFHASFWRPAPVPLHLHGGSSSGSLSTALWWRCLLPGPERFPGQLAAAPAVQPLPASHVHPPEHQPALHRRLPECREHGVRVLCVSQSGDEPGGWAAQLQICSQPEDWLSQSHSEGFYERVAKHTEAGERARKKEGVLVVRQRLP